MEKKTKTLVIKGAKEMPIGSPVSGKGTLSEQGVFTFIPAGKIPPEDFKGMKILAQDVTPCGAWSICHTQNKMRISVTIPVTQKKVMEEAIRNNSFAALTWFISNTK